MKTCSTTLSCYVLILWLTCAGCTSDNAVEAPERAAADLWSQQETEQIESKALKATDITAHVEEKITAGRNLLFCCTFQLAWNELRDDKIKEDVHLTNEPPLVKFLNKGLSTKADISEDCYVAMAGYDWEGILGKVNKALKEKFGGEAPVVNDMLAEDSVFAYAYLQKVLRFKVAFESLKDAVSFTSSDGAAAKIQAFGIRKHSDKEKHLKMAAQVGIPDYRDNSDFVITLKPDSSEDEIVLAKVKPEKTLLETIKAVQARIENGKKAYMDEVETVQIPKLNFNIEHYFEQLCGRSFTNKGFEKYGIDYAVQTVRFKLDEKGAVVKSEARIVTPCEQGPGELKTLIFDRPFLIYLKEKTGKYPYFALWVDNPELLIRH